MSVAGKIMELLGGPAVVVCGLDGEVNDDMRRDLIDSACDAESVIGLDCLETGCMWNAYEQGAAMLDGEYANPNMELRSLLTEEEESYEE